MSVDLCEALRGRVLAAIILLPTLAFVFAACDAEPTKPTATRNASTPTEVAEPAEPKPPRKPIATHATEWPGIEARLMDCSRRGNTLLVEIELANTGTAPFTIENYSAREAVMTDDATKRPYEVFAAGGPPVATDGLTQTLAPNEVTTVTASFPLPKASQLVTVVFPKIGKFEAIPLDKSFNAEKPGAAKNKSR